MLTFGNGPVFEDDNFWNYVRSLRNVQDADYVLLTDNISDEAAAELELFDVNVVNVPKLTHLFRDRHMAFWNYLNDHGHKYKSIIITDCRDVLFQKSPFEWIEDWKTRFDNVQGNKSFLDHFVILTAEGFKTSRSGFACVENFEFQSDLPKEFLKEMKDKWVVNGGVSLGTYRALMNYHLLVWSMMLKSKGRCTDQAAINYLMSVLEEDETYCVSFPQHDWLCLTGEGVKEEAVVPVNDDGVLKTPDGRKYALIHQWDRLDDSLRSSLLSRLE